MRFGVVAFAVWRLAHLAVLAVLGGPFFHFANGDGGWYLRIIEHGYQRLPGDDAQQPTAFFPLLPWVTKGVLFVVRSPTAAAIIVTSAATLAAVVLVHRVVSRWRDEPTARATVILLLAFPASIFLWLFYTEGLFIALSAGALAAQQARRPMLAGVLALFATMTRVPGALIVVALVVDDLQHHRLRRSSLWYGLGSIGIVPIYVAQRVQAGNGFAFLTAANDAWERHPSFPWTTVITAVRELAHGSSRYGAPLDVLAIAVFLIITVLAFQRPWPWAARVLVFGLVSIPLCSGHASSMTRLLSAAWPAFAVVADRRDRLDNAMRAAVLIVLSVVTFAILRGWSRGLFIG